MKLSHSLIAELVTQLDLHDADDNLVIYAYNGFEYEITDVHFDGESNKIVVTIERVQPS